MTLTERMDASSRDILDQVRDRFPNVLNVDSAMARSAPEREAGDAETREMTPLEICQMFMPDITDDQLELLKRVIVSVQEESQ